MNLVDFSIEMRCYYFIHLRSKVFQSLIFITEPKIREREWLGFHILNGVFLILELT
jgi:hypothetical protein